VWLANQAADVLPDDATRSSIARRSCARLRVREDRYVRVTDDDWKGLEGEAAKVDIAEFVPLPAVDLIFFRRPTTSGDKGGDKAYPNSSPTRWKGER
jgi:non-homologous end joining protein Ku